MSSEVVYITTESPFVHVSTREDSSCTFHIKFDNGTPKFTTVALDRLARNGATHLPLRVQLPTPNLVTSAANPRTEGYGPEHSSKHEKSEISLLLASDLDNNIVGLHQHYALRGPDNRNSPSHQGELVPPLSNVAPLFFTANLPRSMTRLHQAPNLRAPWKLQSWDLPGILENNIIGSAADGTIMNFSILSEAGLRLLRFVYDLCENYEIDRKEEENGTRWDDSTVSEMEQEARAELRSENFSMHFEREDKNKRHHHVDGDLLTSIIEEGGSELLRKIIMGQAEISTPGIKSEPGSVFEQSKPDVGSSDQRPSTAGPSQLGTSCRNRFSERPDRHIRELAELIKNLIREEGVPNPRRWDGDLVTVTVRYLKDILEPIV